MRTNAVAHGFADLAWPVARGARRRGPGLIRVAGIGEDAAALDAVLAPEPPGAGRDRLGAAQPGERWRHAAPREKCGDAGWRRPSIDQTGGAQRAEFGRKRDDARPGGDI